MKEFFDVLDEKRNFLGYVKERGEKLADNEYNMGVENYIIWNNKILMTKRSLKKSHPGMWEVPGGCAQSSESSFDTLKREMTEEVGLNINKRNTKFIDTKLYKHQFVDIYQTKTRININGIKMQEDEVSDVKLIDRIEFDRMVMNNEIVPSVIDRFNFIKDKLDLNW